MRETWYVLEDGKVADPNECAPDKTGALRHKSGIPVAMKGSVPHSCGVDIDPEGKASGKTAAAEPKSEAATKAAPKDRELKAKGAKKYETR